MTEELYWLVLTTLMTALFWLPYILNRIMVRGLMGAMGNPSPDDKPEAAWAVRAHAAHNNAVENLVIFAPLVIATQMLGVSTSLTATMCMLYFLARLAHYIIYVLGIPVARTLAFALSFVAEVVLALNLLGMM
ncbi:MAG: MAPEG family protein [Alphaproteobacteria bacterium]|nr:MAPEG family protein [Alphaproteobacteria bacterium]HPF46701.1 MAPEG family protein [Emcibacteraceae bacterium]HRW31016.1 MAPEG family protein [Emcibacteraceae bacterium]